MTAAAEALHTSQPNVSRLIAQLELSTGLKLFERAGVRLIPTKEGSPFFQELERAYVGLDSLRQSAKNIRNLDTGRLHIAAVRSTGLTLIPHVIKDFVATRPELTVSLHMNASPTVVQWVQWVQRSWRSSPAQRLRSSGNAAYNPAPHRLRPTARPSPSVTGGHQGSGSPRRELRLPLP